MKEHGDKQRLNQNKLEHHKNEGTGIYEIKPDIYLYM